MPEITKHFKKYVSVSGHRRFTATAHKSSRGRLPGEGEEDLPRTPDQCQGPAEYRLISTEGLKKGTFPRARVITNASFISKNPITASALPKMSKSPRWGRYCILYKILPSNSEKFWRKEKILWFDFGLLLLLIFCHTFFSQYFYICDFVFLMECFPIYSKSN